MGIKVAQFGTGTAGLRSLKAIINNPSLDLVGVYVARAERAGKDAGSFVDEADTGVLTTNNVQDLIDLKPDCLCYMGSFQRGGVEEVIPFLEAGINVVTPGLGQLLVPAYAVPEMYEPVQAACLKGKSSFFSTGASPGFCTDFFPMSMLGIVDEIEEIIVQEIADYSTYPVVEVNRHWGFGAKPGDEIPLFKNGGKGIADTWKAIPMDIARRLGVEIEEIRVLMDSGLAGKDIPASFYTIPKGTVGNIRFRVQGMVKGKPFVTLEHINYCDFEHMPADWPRPNGKGVLHYRTVVKGRPNLEAEIELDYPVAAVRSVNVIPAIVKAQPGVIAGADVEALPSGNVKLG